MAYQTKIHIQTQGRRTYNITHDCISALQQSNISTGLCHLFIHHTSASLIITENADPDVHRDLETIFQRLAPDADPEYFHTLEGPDDMSAHIRTILTQTELTIPVSNGQLVKLKGSELKGSEAKGVSTLLLAFRRSPSFSIASFNS